MSLPVAQSALQEANIKAYRYLQPQININQPRKWAFSVGGTQTSYYNQVVNGNGNFTLNTWTLNPASEETIIDRKVKIYWPLQLTFNGTGPTGFGPVGSSIGSTDAPRQFPIANSTATLEVRFNGDSVNVPYNLITIPFMRYAKPGLLDQEYSPTTAYPDTTQEYSQSYLGVRNPLGNFQDNERPLRGGFPYTFVTGSQTQTVINVNLEEELYMSPMLFGDNNNAGFVGLNQIIINQTIDPAYLNRLWSHNATNGNPLASISATFVGQPYIRYTAYNVNDKFAPYVRGASYTYDFNWIYMSPFQYSGTINANQTLTNISVNNIQVSSIPGYVMIWGQEQVQNKTFNTTDAFLQINNISVNFINFQNLLQSATQQDLYRIAKKNGYNGSWQDWNNSGSVLKLVFGDDIALPDNLAVGVAGNYQFQYQLTVTNLNPTRSISFTIYTAVVYDGVYLIGNGKGSAQQGVITSADVLTSANLPLIDKDELKSGGDFFDNVKSFFTKTIPSAILPAAKLAKNLIPVLAPQYSGAIPILNALGAGGLSGGRRRRMRGGNVQEEKYEDVQEVQEQPEQEMEVEQQVCESESECGHRSCKGKGGCLECGGKNLPVGEMSKDDLRDRLALGSKREVDLMSDKGELNGGSRDYESIYSEDIRPISLQRQQTGRLMGNGVFPSTPFNITKPRNIVKSIPASKRTTAQNIIKAKLEAFTAVDNVDADGNYL